LNSRIMISALLIAATLAFVSLGNISVTVLQTTTAYAWSSYYAYTGTLTPNFCCGTVSVTLPQPTSALVPFVTNYTLTPTPYTTTSSVTLLTTYETTQTLTNHVPASDALGLSPQAFLLLAATVIGALALLAAWIAFKSRRDGTKPEHSH